MAFVLRRTAKYRLRQRVLPTVGNRQIWYNHNPSITIVYAVLLIID